MKSGDLLMQGILNHSLSLAGKNIIRKLQSQSSDLKFAQLILITNTSMSAVQERPLNLMTHSLQTTSGVVVGWVSECECVWWSCVILLQFAYYLTSCQMRFKNWLVAWCQIGISSSYQLMMSNFTDVNVCHRVAIDCGIDVANMLITLGHCVSLLITIQYFNKYSNNLWCEWFSCVFVVV